MGNKILGKMLDRLYAAVASGPSLNCRPHSSRQRFDLTQFERLNGEPAAKVLNDLLSSGLSVQVDAGHPEPPAAWKKLDELGPHQKEQIKAWEDQQALIKKLRVIAEDSKTYEQDTGAHALFIGYPLLSVPARTGKAGNTKRVLAPVAFIPIEFEVKTGKAASVHLACSDSGIDRVIPNTALLAWVERQSGTKIGETFADEEGNQPWREINELVAAVAKATGVSAQTLDEQTQLTPVPKADSDEQQEAKIIPSAVLGLFPLSNQGLLQDMTAMSEGEAIEGPALAFIKADEALERPQIKDVATTIERSQGEREHLVSAADPCQARAVRSARHSRGLVVHGPPGTGKSQTITNIIGDHLVRGERVLFVCDKRTALDVVLYRLENLGLHELCGVVHDPQRDQRELYMSIRKQLDELPDKTSDSGAKGKLRSTESEMNELHAELKKYFGALQEPDAAQTPLNELVGMWLVESTGVPPFAFSFKSSSVQDVNSLERELVEVFSRAQSENYATSPWKLALGVALGDYLARPAQEWRAEVAALLESAHVTDESADADFPPYVDGVDLTEQGKARAVLANHLQRLLIDVAANEICRWAKETPARAAQVKKQLLSLQPMRTTLRNSEEDPEIEMLQPHKPLAAVAAGIAQLEEYLKVSDKWYGFVFFGRNERARAQLAEYGLSLSTANAQRVHRSLAAHRARIILAEFFKKFIREASDAPKDDELLATLDCAEQVLAIVSDDKQQSELLSHARQELSDQKKHSPLLESLKRSVIRAESLSRIISQTQRCALFADDFRKEVRLSCLRGEKCEPLWQSLYSTLHSVESLLRMKNILGTLAAEISQAAIKLVDERSDHEPQVCLRMLRQSVLAAEIGRRLKSKPELHRLDGDYFDNCFKRFRQLQCNKAAQARDAAIAEWTERQRTRLLATTGSRMSSNGAELKRRLYVKGHKAMRLRQVIASGADIEAGDPLFDVRPVWMASPETVAQIFPRTPIFDVVIFDEASQCRLEEALPVLTRAHRVVIAGDPKQLPPTRFFESTVVQSEQVEAGSTQELFEEQQADVEDLLTAALNLEVEQSYLDVHYRSRNADLIQFSNENFYGSRLQPIPAHPSRRATKPPLRMIAVNGTYENGVNKREAEEIVKLVKELLSQERPPSIGIACFNLTQRDEITDALDNEALRDPDFATAYRIAKARRGNSAFEGLFVKNLENVQGDERDVIIISTTYGPDLNGKFYRRFGPLGMAGGGRRLNVLVTRARTAVHLVTSIPRDAYAAAEPIPPGKTPNGAYLLFSYLRYAELLAALYEQDNQRVAGLKVLQKPEVRVLENAAASPIALELAASLRDRERMSTDVNWGNEGFLVDVAVRHATRPEDVTIGILCDGTRYKKSDDPVEWDIFRTEVLESQGWQLLRVLSPNLFRDVEGTLKKIAAESQKLMAKQMMEEKRSATSTVQ